MGKETRLVFVDHALMDSRHGLPMGLVVSSAGGTAKREPVPEKDEALARYALDGLSNNVMAGQYRITLPNEELLASELDRTRQAMDRREHRHSADDGRLKPDCGVWHH